MTMVQLETDEGGGGEEEGRERERSRNNEMYHADIKAEEPAVAVGSLYYVDPEYQVGKVSHLLGDEPHKGRGREGLAGAGEREAMAEEGLARGGGQIEEGRRIEGKVSFKSGREKGDNEQFMKSEDKIRKEEEHHQRRRGEEEEEEVFHLARSNQGGTNGLLDAYASEDRQGMKANEFSLYRGEDNSLVVNVGSLSQNSIHNPSHLNGCSSHSSSSYNNYNDTPSTTSHSQSTQAFYCFDAEGNRHYELPNITSCDVTSAINNTHSNGSFMTQSTATNINAIHINSSNTSCNPPSATLMAMNRKSKNGHVLPSSILGRQMYIVDGDEGTTVGTNQSNGHNSCDCNYYVNMNSNPMTKQDSLQLHYQLQSPALSQSPQQFYGISHPISTDSLASGSIFMSRMSGAGGASPILLESKGTTVYDMDMEGMGNSNPLLSLLEGNISESERREKEKGKEEEEEDEDEDGDDDDVDDGEEEEQEEQEEQEEEEELEEEQQEEQQEEQGPNNLDGKERWVPQEGRKVVVLPRLRVFTFLRLCPEMLLTHNHEPWLKFMSCMMYT